MERINQKSAARTANRIYKGIIYAASVALAVSAMIYNPAHLFTAALLFAFGMNSEIISKDNYDIC